VNSLRGSYCWSEADFRDVVTLLGRGRLDHGEIAVAKTVPCP
jgi:hypothetical protein